MIIIIYNKKNEKSSYKLSENNRNYKEDGCNQFIGCEITAMISIMLKKDFIKKIELLFPILQKKRSKQSKLSGYNLDNHRSGKKHKTGFMAVKPQFYEELLNEVKDERQNTQL